MRTASSDNRPEVYELAQDLLKQLSDYVAEGSDPREGQVDRLARELGILSAIVKWLPDSDENAEYLIRAMKNQFR